MSQITEYDSKAWSTILKSTPYSKQLFGRPFVKRFALCYRSVVCPVCPVGLSVCLWRSCTVAKRLDGPRWNLACSRGIALHFRSISVAAKWLHGSKCHFWASRLLTFTFAICYRPSVCRLSSVCLSVCLSVCNARAPYSGGSNFPQYLYGIRYIGHP